MKRFYQGHNLLLHASQKAVARVGGNESRPTVAAVVLTKNEERNIGACLDTLLWADELLVVDSGSADSTCAIAEQRGARVVQHSIEPFNASAQRNYALDSCALSSEWVFFLDADERCTDKLEYAIKEHITHAEESCVGFRLAPKFIFMGKWLKRTSHYPVYHDRLTKRGALHYTGLWPTDTFTVTKYHIGVICEPYLHYAMNNGISAWIRKHDIYSTNVAHEVLSFSRDPKNDDFGIRSFALKASQWLFLGVLARFLYELFGHGGIWDGYPGLVYAGMRAMYQFMIGLKVIEQKRQKSGFSL